MALDRWIALIILMVCLIYGYTAFFTMDAGMAPFMKNNPIWPSSFPKVLSVLAAITALVVLLGLEGHEQSDAPKDIDYRKLHEYKLGQAIILLVAMVAYALLLRPLGFIASTSLFLIGGSMILGERKFIILIPVALIATGFVWYLVQEVLGIFLSPWPSFF